MEGAEVGKEGDSPRKGLPRRKIKMTISCLRGMETRRTRDRNDTGEEMPVKDDGHPLPYQDHQRCNNGTPPLTKEDAVTVH